MKAHHTLVTGDSGGGKTTLLRELADTYPGLTISLEDGEDDVVDGRRLDDAATVSSVREIARSPASTIAYKTSDKLAAADEIRPLVHDYYETTGYPTQVLVDEAQEVLPDGDVEATNPVKRMLHKDRSRGVKVVLATQDPTDLEYTPIKQVEHWVWCGPWSTFHDGFLRYFNIPREELPTEPFEFVKFDKRMNVVYRGETKERYG